MEKIVTFPAREMRAVETAEQNEAFSVDFENLQRYNSLKAELTELLESNADVIQLTEIAPEPAKPHAVLCLDVKQAAIFRGNEIGLLSAVLQKADLVMVSSLENRTRFGLAVENIWLDG